MIVSLKFTGLCAIAPGAPENDRHYEGSGPLRVTMPYSSRRRNSQSPPPAYIPTHIPFILTRAPLVPMTAVRTPARPPDDRVTRLGHAGAAGANSQHQSGSGKTPADVATNVWIPIRERLTIKVDGEYQPGKLYYDPDLRLQTSDMRRVWRDRARFRRECDPLYPVQRGVDPAVLTQVLVPFGTVKPHFRTQPTGAVFDPPKPVDGRPVQYDSLAPEITVEFEANESVTISSQSLVNGEDLDDIIVYGGENQAVEIVIGNSDLEDLRLRIEGRTAEPAPGPDADFELYYSLLRDPDIPSADDEDLPIPSPGGGGGLIKNCYISFVQ